MATRTCPNCGTQYLATVRRCIDCDATLVDDLEAASATDEVREERAPDGDHTVSLALAGWGNQLKVTLDGMLERQSIPRAWEAGVLVIPGSFREKVGELIEAVEGHELPELDEDAPMVALVIEDLDTAGLEDLDGRLSAASIAHAWSDDGELLVAEADESAVVAIVEAVYEDEHDDDGSATADAISNLFLASDRLAKRVGDSKSELAYLDAARALEAVEVPYGLDGTAWRQLVDEALAVADLVERSADSDADGDADADGEGDDVLDEVVVDDDAGDLPDRLITLRERLRELV